MNENAINLPVQQDRAPAPSDLLRLALSQGAGVDQLERLMGLQERYEAMEAKKAYVVAMAAFKANPPRISKDRHVSFQTSKGQTEYDHASLANVTESINSALSLNGLSASWKTAQIEKSITVTCCITHVLGHQECTSLSAFGDDSGGKNSIQGIGSTVSYLSRYTLLALTGLATHDQDTDGANPKDPEVPEEKITVAQINELSRILESKKYDADIGLKAIAKAKKLKDMDIRNLPMSGYQSVLDRSKAMVENPKPVQPEPGAEG